MKKIEEKNTEISNNKMNESTIWMFKQNRIELNFNKSIECQKEQTLCNEQLFFPLTKKGDYVSRIYCVSLMRNRKPFEIENYTSTL